MTKLFLSFSGKMAAIMALAACLLVGCNAAAEQAAFRKIRDAGGQISFAGGGPEISFINRKVTDEQLAAIQALPYIHRLRIVNVPLTDSAVDILLSLERLDSLEVENTKMSREGLERLKAKYPNMKQ